MPSGDIEAAFAALDMDHYDDSGEGTWGDEGMISRAVVHTSGIIQYLVTWSCYQQQAVY